MLAVLGLWLGAAIGGSRTVEHAVPTMSHSVAAVQVALRPPVPDVQAVPAELVGLTVVLVAVLIGTRQTIRHVPVRNEIRHGRAPPRGRSTF